MIGGGTGHHKQKPDGPKTRSEAHKGHGLTRGKQTPANLFMETGRFLS